MNGGTSPTSPEARTLMQSLLADLTSLRSNAQANLDAAAGQRNRLLGDLPPTAETSDKPGTNALGGSVSFSDVNVVVEQIRNALLATNEHLLSLRSVG